MRGRRPGAVEEARQAERADRVDTRGTCKPVSFTAAEEEVLEKPFPVWQRKLHNHTMRVLSDLGERMEWAANQATPISEAEEQDQDDGPWSLMTTLDVTMMTTRAARGGLTWRDVPHLLGLGGLLSS